MNIQDTLDKLQPYVIGIRYLDGTPLVDAVFKEGWTVIEDANIKKVKGDDGLNYYMIFSEIKGIGLDELLNYVGKVIKANLEREKKHELLRLKVDELKQIFKNNSLSKLSELKFVFQEKDLVPTLDEFDIDVNIDYVEETSTPEIVYHESINETVPEQKVISYLDENKQPIELTDDEKEELEEEARGERNRKMLEDKKRNKSNKPVIPKNVELPPKQKQMAYANSDCDCSENEACGKCMDSKDY